MCLRETEMTTLEVNAFAIAVQYLQTLSVLSQRLNGPWRVPEGGDSGFEWKGLSTVGVAGMRIGSHSND